MVEPNFVKTRLQIYPDPETNPDLTRITEVFRLQAERTDHADDGRLILTFATNIGKVSVLPSKLQYLDMRSPIILISGQAAMGGLKVVSDSPVLNITYNYMHGSGQVEYLTPTVE